MTPLRSAHLTAAATPARVAACALAALLCVNAGAAENGNQRYSAGIGGSDMTAPLMPGWYVQAPVVAYHAKKIKGDDGKQATSRIPNSQLLPGGPYRAAVDVNIDVRAIQPRITYIDNTRWLGANLGFTMMLPIVQRHADFKLTSLVPEPINTGANVQAGLNDAAAALSRPATGIGDFEFGGIMHWELADNQALTLVNTFIVPTGDYDPDRRLNPGFGNFYTFRPSIQYSYIGDGWDFGVRGVLSFNTRNKETGYRSGNMANVDFQLMTFVAEDIRMGLQGFAVHQFQNDSQDLSYITANPTRQAEIINGNRMRAYGLGPAVGWLKDGGDMMVEGKFIKEFGARNRTEGQAFWLTISKPLGL